MNSLRRLAAAAPAARSRLAAAPTARTTRALSDGARPPLPPFTLETAIQKVRAAEDATAGAVRKGIHIAVVTRPIARASHGGADRSHASRRASPIARVAAAPIASTNRKTQAWNNRDATKVPLAYTEDTRWRNRDEIFSGRAAVQAFLERKWAKEHDYRLIKEYWAHAENRIAVRFAYEYTTGAGEWYRAYGNENWEFDERGLMRTRHASINDLRIARGPRGKGAAAPRRQRPHANPRRRRSLRAGRVGATLHVGIGAAARRSPVAVGARPLRRPRVCVVQRTHRCRP